jgi:hypothetical protein
MGDSTTTSHQIEEIDVGFGGLHVLQHQFHGFNFIEVVNKLSQYTGLLEDFWG